ncbi:BQ5605_C050g12485 [Microbotryum silenes-dioicae]|uniref:BQ5605_C050g12485 protein n=1 Tax=Microbotryum silenes-dioicae TaxID=796604 RepID=A0A2X0MP12_9BASI|nr:BQ5605_C050g12485 [Microbotryum silenes-dioicae]
MTTIQPILALRHVYEPAPHVSIRDDLGPQTAVCTHCKAQHWELGATVFCVFGRLYHRLGALIPAVNQRPAFAQTWLINPAEATDTRLQGPDSAKTRIQRSTLTKLESMLRTGNRFMREFASAKARAGWDTAKEWILRLCLPPGRDRRTHNLPTSSTEMAMLICDSDTNTGDREDGFHPNIPLCGSIELGHSSPKDSNKEGEDEEEGDKKNGDGEHKHLWLLLGCSHSVKARAQTDIECLNTYDEGQVKGVKVVSLAFTDPLRSTCTNATSPHGTRRPFPAFTARHHAAIPGCDGVRCQTWKASAAHHDDVRPRLTGNQGRTGADKACNRPDLIARVFEAKSGNKRHAGCFGNECKMNGFCFFATVRLSCYFLNFILPLI